MELLGPIPIDLNLDMVQTKLRTPDRDSVVKLMQEALALAEARAVATVAYVEEKGDDQVLIGGQRFKSRVLRKNLDDIGRVFPAVVTIGSRLEERATRSADILTQYYLDMIGNLILAEARSQLIQSLCRRFAIDRLSWMSPGSLEDWPIEEQRPLSAFSQKPLPPSACSSPKACSCSPANPCPAYFFRRHPRFSAVASARESAAIAARHVMTRRPRVNTESSNKAAPIHHAL